MRRLLAIVGLGAGLIAALAGPVSAQDIDPDALSAAVTAEPASAAPGTSGTIRVILQLVPEHHIYGNDAEFSPTTVKISPVEGVTFGTPVYPKSHVVERWGEQSREYDGEFDITVPFTVAADAAPGARTITALLSYQVCNEELCLDPVKDEAHVATLTITAAPAAPTDPVAPAKPVEPKKPAGLPPLGGPTPDPGDATAELVSAVADADGVALTFRMPAGWHIGPVTMPEGAIGQETRFELQGAALNGAVTEPAPTTTNEAGFESAYHKGTVTLRLPLRYDAGATEVRGTAIYQICSSGVGGVCMDGQTAFAFAVPTGAAVDPGKQDGPAEPGGQPAGPTETGPVTPEQAPTAPVESEDDDDLSNKGFFAFLLACVGGGLFSLIMPCVYPLIPITVTFFAKQAGESGQGKTMGLALMYGLGIVTSFTALGLVLTLAIGATGATVFASNPWVNTVIALVFLYLTLALFGLVPLDLPSGLKNKLSGGGPQKGFVGAYVLGLIFTVVTFTCVIPIAGSLLIIAADGGWVKATVGMLVYSGTMAVPFLALGLFPALVRKMPMGGGWLHTVKMTGGFIELALVVYYWTKADQGFFGKDVFINHDMALSIYVAAFLLCGTYLLGMWRTPEDGDVRAIGVPRMLFAFVFSVFGLYLSTGLAGKDLGVLEALLPFKDDAGTTQVASITPGAGGPQKQKVYENFEEGMAVARDSGKPVFLEFTGFS